MDSEISSATLAFDVTTSDAQRGAVVQSPFGSRIGPPKGGTDLATGTEDYYRARAPEYDQVYAKPERQQNLQEIRTWLPGVLAGRRVLEVATGTGYWTDVFADRTILTVATDVNAATLDLTRSRRRWPRKVRFEESDAFHLANVDDNFDAAFAGFFWSHLPLCQVDLFLQGLLGCMDDHAVLVFLDNNYVEGSNHQVTRTDADANTYQLRELSDGSKWEVLKNFPTAEDLQRRLNRYAGSVAIEEWTYYWAAVGSVD
jgi:SAM-dependent methyltransferase